MSKERVEKKEEVTLLEKVERRLQELLAQVDQAFQTSLKTKEQFEELASLREEFPEDEISKLDDLLRERAQENVAAVEEYNKLSARYEQVLELYNILKD